MSGIPTVEYHHCSELAMPPGSLLEFTSRFLPAGQLEPLLALYALKQAVSAIVHAPADDSVKWAKLNWWSEEIVADPVSPSRHPVLRALYLSGARTQLNNVLLQRLISNASMEIDAVPDRDENAMFERLAALGSTDIQLELALDNAEIGTPNLEFLAAATSSFRMISSFAINQRSETERLPLSLLAKYNVSTAQLAQNLQRDELAKMIEQLAGNALDWFSKGMSGMKILPKSGIKICECTHLQLRWAMENRQLAMIRKDVRGFLDASKRYGPTDAWFAWRFLRRLKSNQGAHFKHRC
jgi:phytoene/squalene synthetase